MGKVRSIVFGFNWGGNRPGRFRSQNPLVGSRAESSSPEVAIGTGWWISVRLLMDDRMRVQPLEIRRWHREKGQQAGACSLSHGRKKSGKALARVGDKLSNPNQQIVHI